jgi:hypothetical protein
MAHTLAAITIHVDDRGYTRNKSSNYSRQHPLDAVVDTIGFFGSNSAEFDLDFMLDETLNSGTGLATLEAAVDANSNVNLTLDNGSQGNVRILNLSATRVQALNKSDEVWACTARLVSV